MLDCVRMSVLVVVCACVFMHVRACWGIIKLCHKCCTYFVLYVLHSLTSPIHPGNAPTSCCNIHSSNRFLASIKCLVLCMRVYACMLAHPRFCSNCFRRGLNHHMHTHVCVFVQRTLSVIGTAALPSSRPITWDLRYGLPRAYLILIGLVSLP